MNEYIIETKDLSKKHGTQLRVNNLCLQIPEGCVYGFLGPNGAGKSTTIKLLLGLLKVHEGAITCDGVNIFDNYPAWLAQIGYIPQTIYLVDESIRNNIAFGIADDEINDEPRIALN